MTEASGSQNATRGNGRPTTAAEYRKLTKAKREFMEVQRRVLEQQQEVDAFDPAVRPKWSIEDEYREIERQMTEDYEKRPFGEVRAKV